MAAAPKEPLVSVVVPTYQRAGMLTEVLDSVLAQTFADWELLIVDDNGEGSRAQKETAAAVERYRNDSRILYIPHERNRGACAARNTGLDRARGTFVAFLDDDDLWHPEKLERQVACFGRASPEVALVYGGWRHVREDGTVRTFIPSGSAHRLPLLLMRNAIGSTSLVMCRRSALLAVDGFDTTLPAMQDFDLYIRLGIRFPFAYVEDVLMDHRRHDRARITTDPQAVLVANERFYAKHRQLFETDRDVHRERLRAYAYDMLRIGQFAKARRLYRSAWRVDRRSLLDLALGLFVHRRMVEAYRVVKRWVRPTSLRRASLQRARGQDRHAS
jgi:glycosyltransferase involved in cell wall biosynthesis